MRIVTPEYTKSHGLRAVRGISPNGATENARHENAAQGKLRGWKMQEWKIHHISHTGIHEIAWSPGRPGHCSEPRPMWVRLYNT